MVVKLEKQRGLSKVSVGILLKSTRKKLHCFVAVLRRKGNIENCVFKMTKAHERNNNRSI